MWDSEPRAVLFNKKQNEGWDPEVFQFSLSMCETFTGHSEILNRSATYRCLMQIYQNDKLSEMFVNSSQLTYESIRCFPESKT